MKSINRKSFIWFALLAFAGLSSFTSFFGGEGFEVFVNKQRVLSRFHKEMNDIQNIQVRAGDQISVKYYHCGKQGKNRSLMLKDENNKLVKQWRFSDEGSTLNCSMKEVDGQYQAKSHGSLSLIYVSSEIPDGRLLASITVADAEKTRP